MKGSAMLSLDKFRDGVLLCLIFLMSLASLISLIQIVGAQNDSLTISIVPGSSSPFNGQFYVPNSASTPANTSITWTNQDTSSHTITSGDFTTGPSGQFDSGLLDTGATFTHQFTTPGLYTYYCTIFPFMSGSVNVTAQ
jgi:nitrite reductase (NO-forming)